MQITNLLPPLTDFRTTIFPDLFTVAKTANLCEIPFSED